MQRIRRDGRQCHAAKQVSSFIPSNIATENSDYRLVTCTTPNVPTGCELDSYAGTRSSTTPWNAGTRSLSFSGDLTLKGGDYFVCSLTLAGNSHLIMAAGAHVRIFFDTPKNCGLSSPATQLSLTGNSNIEATNFKPGLSETDLPALYFLGSSTTASTINIEGNASSNNDFLIYAPNTEIRIAGNGKYNGIIAGKTMTVAGNGTIIRPKGYEPPQIGGSVLYSPPVLCRVLRRSHRAAQRRLLSGVVFRRWGIAPIAQACGSDCRAR